MRWVGGSNGWETPGAGRRAGVLCRGAHTPVQRRGGRQPQAKRRGNVWSGGWGAGGGEERLAGCRPAPRALCPPATLQQHFCAGCARRLGQAGAVPGVQSGGPARPAPCLSPSAHGLRLSRHGFRLWLIRGRPCAQQGGRAGGRRRGWRGQAGGHSCRVCCATLTAGLVFLKPQPPVAC